MICNSKVLICATETKYASTYKYLSILNVKRTTKSESSNQIVTTLDEDRTQNFKSAANNKNDIM